MQNIHQLHRPGFNEAFPISIGIATLLHFALLAWGPSFGTDVRYDVDDEPPIYLRPIELDLPAAPRAIPRPATPIISDAVTDETITLETVPFEQYVPPPPPPPAATSGGDRLREQFEAFVPSMTAPRILNAAAVERALEQRYPALLRDAGITGTVDVELWLDERGGVVRAQVARSSGHDSMDAAALSVVDVMRLSPALNRGRAVRVIVTVPIQFSVR